MAGKTAADVLEREELKPVPLKRKAVADGDKVRYRVYRAPDDYVAVIAENALMAMKLSRISNPHRIMRDLPMAKVAVEQEALVTHHLQPTVFIRPDLPMPEPKKAQYFETVAVIDEEFVPLELDSLRKLGARQDQLIDAETLLNSLKVPEGQAAVSPTPATAPMMEPPAAAMPPVEPEPQAAAEPAPQPVAPEAPVAEGKLSEDEVQRLLNS